MPTLSPEQLQHTLTEAVARLRNALSPSAIYLYGSYVYGTPGPHSDIDLLVVVEDSGRTPFQRDAIAYRALGDIPVPIDVQVYTEREFEERSALTVSFERTVKTKGKLLHVDCRLAIFDCRFHRQRFREHSTIDNRQFLSSRRKSAADRA
jgi:predicted nucleotidyltransferase